MKEPILRMACANTDREIWRKNPGDYYSPSIHVTESGSIGINVGGHVLVAPVERWFRAGETLFFTTLIESVPPDSGPRVSVDYAQNECEWREEEIKKLESVLVVEREKVRKLRGAAQATLNDFVSEGVMDRKVLRDVLTETADKKEADHD